MSKYHHLLACRNHDLIWLQRLIWKNLIKIPYQSISMKLYVIAKRVLFVKIFPELIDRQPNIMNGRVPDVGHYRYCYNFLNIM